MLRLIVGGSKQCESCTLQHNSRRFYNGAEAMCALAGGNLDSANIGSSVVAVAATPIGIRSELGAGWH